MSKLIAQTITIVGICFAGVGVANANLPKDISEAYQTYEIALDARRFEEAEAAAYDAWQNAEIELGDTKVTGDLAQNYADILAFNQKSFSKTKKAYRRAIELSKFYPEEDSLIVRMDRTVSLSAYAQANGRLKHTRRDLDKVIKEAENANAAQSTFLGEIYTLRAGCVSLSRNAKEAKELGRRAEVIFAAAEDGIASPFESAASRFANLDVSINRFSSEQTPERTNATVGVSSPAIFTPKPR